MGGRLVILCHSEEGRSLLTSTFTEGAATLGMLFTLHQTLLHRTLTLGPPQSGGRTLKLSITAWVLVGAPSIRTTARVATSAVIW